MITQYRFSLSGSVPLHPPDAYRLYSWLLQQVPEEFGEMLHQQTRTPVSQYLVVDRTDGKCIWTVSLFGHLAKTQLAPLLDGLTQIDLHTGVYRACCLERRNIASVQALVAAAETLPGGKRTTLQFCAPTSFKQNGHYMIFPQERLILQSLIAKWDEIFPDYPLSDPDAVQMLEQGIRITDYRLRSARYAMKGIRIPGFIGEITLGINLSPPMLRIWNCLCMLSTFTGVGIKTALGMGGVRQITGQAE